MTENEALEILNNECEDISKVQIALKVAREALEEIQQYRAIGTVEKLQGQKEYIDTINEVCSGYSAIGTIEEFKDLKEQEEALARNASMVGNLQGVARKRGYDEATDEFARRMKELHPTDGHINATIHRAIDGVAKQMKAGGKNE